MTAVGDCLFSVVPLCSSFGLVANVLASWGLHGSRGLIGLFLSLVVLSQSSSLKAGEYKMGPQAMSTFFTTNFTNSENGGKFLYFSSEILDSSDN